MWILASPLFRANGCAIYLGYVPKLDFASIYQLQRLVRNQAFAIHSGAMCCAEVYDVEAANGEPCECLCKS